MNHNALARIRSPEIVAHTGGVNTIVGSLLLSLVTVPVGAGFAMYYVAKDEGKKALWSAGLGLAPLGVMVGDLVYENWKINRAIAARAADAAATPTATPSTPAPAARPA